MKFKTLLLTLSLIFCSFLSVNAQEQFFGEIRLFAGDFPPRGWAFCDGQTLLIQQYPAVFSLLGTKYGGDGIKTFALPDLRGRVAVHSGGAYNPELDLVVQIGEKGGVLTNSVKPSDVSVKTSGVKLDAQTTGRDGVPTLVTSVVVNNQASPQKIDNRQPYLGLNYIICLDGYYPSRQ